MRMMDELKPLFLYSAKKKVHIPINDSDRRHGAAILLLSPSVDITSRLIKLPYIYNPGLYTSLYMHRNAMDYINYQPDILQSLRDDDGNFDALDEKEEEAISESLYTDMLHLSAKVKFKFEDGVTIIDKKNIEGVYNKSTINNLCIDLNLYKINTTIYIKIHPNVSSMQEELPKDVLKAYDGNKVYSYSKDDTIHVLSKRVYDPEDMGGDYSIYLKYQLIVHLLMKKVPDANLLLAMAIAQYKSGMLDWMDDKDHKDKHHIGFNELNRLARSIKNADSYKSNNQYAKPIKKMLKPYMEDTLTYMDRQNLLPSDFGVPNKRKYPMPDAEHVTAAIRMFNNCDPDDEKELAESIIRKVHKFGMDPKKISVSAANRFRPYWVRELEKLDLDSKKKNDKDKNKDGIKNKISSTISNIKSKITREDYLMLTEAFMDSDYADILCICDHLSPEEFKKISFYDTYRDSKFVIKRIIKRVDGQPAGFLDVYQFPSKANIAQITIAVDNRFRGQHVADSMVKELIESDLDKENGFDFYYWTANRENLASQNLALKNGFIDTGYVDKYDRKVFVHPTSNVLSDRIDIKDIPEELHSDDNYAVTTEGAFITEAVDDKTFNRRLKQYIYKERLKNNKEVLTQYDQIKERNPEIKKTYIKIEMYKGYNLFIDFSYYHGLYLRNNKLVRDNAVNFYIEFLSDCISGAVKDLGKAMYPKKTIFIPVDMDAWDIKPGTDPLDHTKNLNPMSMIYRLVRKDPAKLAKSKLKDYQVVFVGSKGYFSVDFNNFGTRNLSKFKTNITKLMSNDQIIEDEDDDIDEIEQDSDDTTAVNTDTPKARAAKMIDKIEKSTDIKVDDISSIKSITPPKDTDSDEDDKPSKSVAKDTEPEITKQLTLVKEPIKFKDDIGNVAIISLDPDGPDGFERLSKTVLSNIGNATTYCIIK